jgi:hypothetical protein
MTLVRYIRFVGAFFELLRRYPGRAPTPSDLNVAMGRARRNCLDGELTRWRTVLLRECGFVKAPGVVGRWKPAVRKHRDRMKRLAANVREVIV